MKFFKASSFLLLISLFVGLTYSSYSYAGIISKGVKVYAIGKIGGVAIKAALKSESLKKAAIKLAKKDNKFKTKAKEKIQEFIKNPKYSKYKEKAKIFYKELVGVPQRIKNSLPKNYQFAGKKFPKDNYAVSQSGKILTQNEKIILRNKLHNKYPEGVNFNINGFPDFTRYAIKRVKIKTKGNRNFDFKMADKKAGINKAYRDKNKLTWHHHQDMQTLELVPRDLHNAIRHSGGISKLKDIK